MMVKILVYHIEGVIAQKNKQINQEKQKIIKKKSLISRIELEINVMGPHSVRTGLTR